MSHAFASTRPTSVARSRAWWVVMLMALAGLVLTAVPAHAHDTLISSDPEDGASLEEAPEEAVLTFSAEITPSGALAVLRDADGTETELPEPTYDGRDAVWELPALEGDQTLVWSVISSDGHRIEGEIDFTVTASGAGGEEPTDDETPSDEAGGAGQDEETSAAGTDDGDAAQDDATEDGDSGEDAGTEDDAAADDAAGTDEGATDGAADAASEPADDAATTDDEDDDSGSGLLPWIGAGLVLVAGAAVWFFMSRRGSGTGDAEQDATDA